MYLCIVFNWWFHVVLLFWRTFKVQRGIVRHRLGSFPLSDVLVCIWHFWGIHLINKTLLKVFRLHVFFILIMALFLTYFLAVLNVQTIVVADWCIWVTIIVIVAELLGMNSDIFILWIENHRRLDRNVADGSHVSADWILAARFRVCSFWNRARRICYKRR